MLPSCYEHGQSMETSGQHCSLPTWFGVGYDLSIEILNQILEMFLWILGRPPRGTFNDSKGIMKRKCRFFESYTVNSAILYFIT